MRIRAGLVCLLAAAGCRGEAREAGSPAPAVDPASVPGRLTLELWQVRPGVTLADWASAHLNDQIVPDTMDTTGWQSCGRGVSNMEVAGRFMIREAHFVPPEPPADLALPDSASVELAGACVLSAIRVAARATDSSAAQVLQDSVAAQLREAFGRPSADSMTRTARWAFWRRQQSFERGPVKVMIAWEPADAADTIGPRVVAMAWLRDETSDLPLGSGPRYVPVDSFPLDSAIALSGMDSARATELRRLATSRAPDSQGTLQGFFRPMTRWIRAAERLPLPQRAAALYAADQALERALCIYGLCDADDSLRLAMLQRLGARFTWSPLGGTWNSNRSWMSMARVLDRDSPLGNRIFLAQMNRGFDLSGTCARSTEGFRAVIENGELYLERVPDSPIASDVHFLVAEAYRDIVALAMGAGDIYADVSRYQPEAAAARTSALAHYRAAIAEGREGPAARAAWQQAWALMAGFVPRDTRFYCVYD